jgi:hypothetical protein
VNNKRRRLQKLAAAEAGRLRRLFPSWRRMPVDVRSDPDQMKRWAAGLIAIAAAAAEAGDLSFMMLLRGNPDENPLDVWQRAFMAANAEMEEHPAEAIRIMEAALKQADGLAGPDVESLWAKSYGLLGLAYYRTGNRESARTFTVKARNACSRIGDAEGVAIYTSNLTTIDEG